jgi:hypothetical protein
MITTNWSKTKTTDGRSERSNLVPVVFDRHFFVRGTPLGKIFFGRQSTSVHPREAPFEVTRRHAD